MSVYSLEWRENSEDLWEHLDIGGLEYVVGTAYEESDPDCNLSPNMTWHDLQAQADAGYVRFKLESLDGTLCEYRICPADPETI